MTRVFGSRFTRWWNVEALPPHTARPFRSISTAHYARHRATRMFGPYVSFAEKHPLTAAIVISLVATVIFIAISGGPPSISL
jgi:hypothetical protein